MTTITDALASYAYSPSAVMCLNIYIIMQTCTPWRCADFEFVHFCSGVHTNFDSKWMIAESYLTDADAV